jgi:hypothetical protein
MLKNREDVFVYGADRIDPLKEKTLTKKLSKNHISNDQIFLQKNITKNTHSLLITFV